jgi:fructose-1,6-bisphosphatase/inositol monophosphatase family enzyme
MLSSLLRGKKTGEEVGFRFYNLAGNPMMMRLVDGSVDIVFDIKGQAPHDVVPGAFIAVKAGAVLAQPTGSPLTLADLSTSLLQPGSPAAQLTYVLGANQNMVAEMTRLLAEEWDGKVDRRIATVDRRQGWARPPQIQTPPPGP